MKKRILLVASEFPPGPGGIGYHAFCLAKELSNISSVLILCNGDYANQTELNSFDASQKFEIIRYKRVGLFTPLHRVFMLSRMILKSKPNSIIYTGLFSIWLVNIGKIFSDIDTKHFSIIHGHEPIFGGDLQKKLTSYSLQKFDFHIPVSRFSKDNLLTVLKRIDNKPNFRIIPNGIDLIELSNWCTKSESNRKNLIPMLNGYPKLLTVGHTSPRKGQHNVIKALPEILKTFPNCFYYILGRDVDNRGLHQLSRELGVSERVKFIQPIKEHFDLSYYYENADIFMLLSENQGNGDVEGFGIVALEANYFGCPVIGAKGCGVEDAVSIGKSGYIVSCNDVFEISSAISEIVKMGESLKKTSKSHAKTFDWSILGQQFTKLLCAE